MEIETPVLLAYAIEDSTDIFRISGGGLNTPNPPLGTPLLATAPLYVFDSDMEAQVNKWRCVMVAWTGR